jgi:DNA-binding NarL/FixJ family response regulator
VKRRLPPEPPSGLTATSLRVGAQPLVLFSFPIPDAPEALTEAQRHVAELLAAGKTNREIAEARGTSTHTVAKQVASLLRKFSVSSRYELIALLAGVGRPRDAAD